MKVIPIKHNIIGDGAVVGTPFLDYNKGIVFEVVAYLQSIEIRRKINETTAEVEKEYFILKVNPIENNQRTFSLISFDKYLLHKGNTYVFRGYVNYCNGNFYLAVKNITIKSP